MPTLQRREITVRVTKDAVLDCLLATAEAAVVSPSLNEGSFDHLSAYLTRSPIRDGDGHHLPPSLTFSESGLETAGLLWGHELKEGGRRVVVVQRMTPLSAINRGDNFVEWSQMSIDVMAELAAAAKAPWTPVGDFHSHPFLNVDTATIETDRLYRPTECDRNNRGPKNKSRLGLIMSIAERRKKRPARELRARSAANFQISKFDIWVCAFYTRGRGVTPRCRIEL